MQSIVRSESSKKKANVCKDRDCREDASTRPITFTSLHPMSMTPHDSTVSGNGGDGFLRSYGLTSNFASSRENGNREHSSVIGKFPIRNRMKPDY